MELDYSKMQIPELQAELFKRLDEAEKIGVKWAASKALCEDLEDKKKSKLASLQGLFGGPQNSREREALASKQFAEFMDGLDAARQDYLRCQVFWDLIKVRLDCLRTLISARKVEIQNFGG